VQDAFGENMSSEARGFTRERTTPTRYPLRAGFSQSGSAPRARVKHARAYAPRPRRGRGPRSLIASANISSVTVRSLLRERRPAAPRPYDPTFGQCVSCQSVREPYVASVRRRTCHRTCQAGVCSHRRLSPPGAAWPDGGTPLDRCALPSAASGAPHVRSLCIAGLQVNGNALGGQVANPALVTLR
jgi:hypothetical protein